MCESVKHTLIKPKNNMKKTNAIATVNATATAIETATEVATAIETATANNEKTNAKFDRNTLMKLYVSCGANCTHDTANYGSLDNGSNNTIIFSPNYKKTRFNIYCNENVFNTLKTLKLTDTVFDGQTNTSSKTIPFTILCKSVDDMKVMIKKLVDEKLVRLLPTEN